MSNLNEAVFDMCNMYEADLGGVDAPKARFLRCEGKRTNFDAANLYAADFSGKRGKTANDFSEANFTRADITRANFDDCNLELSILAGAKADHASFRGASLRRVKAPGLHAHRANFTKSDILYGKFSGADLTGSNFSGAALHKPDFSNAILRSVDFSRANLIDPDFTGADLTGAKFPVGYSRERVSEWEDKANGHH